MLDPLRTTTEVGTDKPWVYRRPRRSAFDRLSYLIPNRVTCENDPIQVEPSRIDLLYEPEQ